MQSYHPFTFVQKAPEYCAPSLINANMNEPARSCLPPEILHKIFANFPLHDLLTSRLACSYWDMVIRNITGLPLILKKSPKQSQLFASSIKVNSLKVFSMSNSRSFALKKPSALQNLYCSGLINSSWFISQVLNLPNLTELHLHGDFFYLQELTSTHSTFLPNLVKLVAEIPDKFQPLSQPPSCGVFPKIQTKIAERIATNICIILKVIRSPKLSTLEIMDNFPRNLFASAQRNQWCGQVIADFVIYHCFSLTSLRIRKEFNPWPEDPFTSECTSYPSLTKLHLNLLGPDVGTYHYWRALIEAQRNLETLRLQVSGAFWRRFSIVESIKNSCEYLTHLDLSLDYDMDNPDDPNGGTFDFECIRKCTKLKFLKVGPCGYLTPTRNFGLIPPLLSQLESLELIFLDITTNELALISEFESLKSLRLHCLVQIIRGRITSPVNISILKTFLTIRTLETIGVDFITSSDSKAIATMATKMFGRKFKGNGFFCPFDLEDQVTITNGNLRAASPEPEPQQCTGPTFAEIIQRLDAESGDISGPKTRTPNCPCETRKRKLRRNPRCVCRYCIPAMVDICEDLLKAGKPELWDSYVDGVIKFNQIRKFIPDDTSNVGNEEHCNCESSSEDEDSVAMEILTSSRRRVSCAEIDSAALQEPLDHLDPLISKDWCTQTDLRRQDSMTQYENQGVAYDFKCIRNFISDSESQTDLQQSKSMTDFCMQKDFHGNDISIQKEVQGKDSSTQHVVQLKESSSQKDVNSNSVYTQKFVCTSNVEIQAEIRSNLVDMATQKDTLGEDKACRHIGVISADIGIQKDMLGVNKSVQNEQFYQDGETNTSDTPVQHQASQSEYAGASIGTQKENFGIEKQVQVGHVTEDEATQYENNSTVDCASQAERAENAEIAMQTFLLANSMASQTVEINKESTGFQATVRLEGKLIQAVPLTTSSACQFDLETVEHSSIQVELKPESEDFEGQVEISKSIISKEIQYEGEQITLGTQYEVVDPAKDKESQWEGPAYICAHCKAQKKDIRKKQSDAETKSVNGNDGGSLADYDLDDQQAFGDAVVVQNEGRKKRKTGQAGSNGAVRRYCIIS